MLISPQRCLNLNTQSKVTPFTSIILHGLILCDKVNHWPQLFIFPPPLSLYSLIVGRNLHLCSLTSGLSIWFPFIAYQFQTMDLKDHPCFCLLSCTSGMSLQGTCAIQRFGSKMKNLYSRSIPADLGTCGATQAPRAWNQATCLSLF